MFWDEYVNVELQKYICQRRNFIYLNGKNVLYPRVSEIVWSYIEKDEKIFEKMKKYFTGNKKTFQCAYAICYPDI